LRKIRPWLPEIAKAAFAASLIAWLIHRGALDLRAVAEALTRWPLVLVVAVLFCAQAAVLAYRWDILLRAQDAGLRYRDAFSLTMIGLLFNVVSPGAVGGDLIKSYYVHRHARERHAEAVATIVLDRIIGMITLFIVASVAAVPALFFSAGNARLRTLALGAVAAAAVGLGGLALAIRISRAAAARKHSNVAIRFVLRAFGSLLIYRNRPAALIRPMAVSALGWLLSCAAFYAAALAVGAPAFSLGLIFLVPLGLMTTALPVSPGGIGVGQVAFAELFRIASNGEYSFGANAYTVLQAVQIVGSLSGFFFYLGWRRELRAAAPPEVPTSAPA
jgi:glycosyltransferase 2 family protein